MEEAQEFNLISPRLEKFLTEGAEEAEEKPKTSQFVKSKSVSSSRGPKAASQQREKRVQLSLKAEDLENDDDDDDFEVELREEDKKVAKEVFARTSVQMKTAEDAKNFHIISPRLEKFLEEEK